MNTGFSGSERSYTWVMRRTRHPSTPDTRYAMPVSHSHQLLFGSLRFSDTVVRSTGFAGSATFQIWWARPPKVRRRYTLALSPFGSCAPSHTRVIWAPPASARPGWPGMCARYLGRLGSVTSTIDV